MMDLNEFNQRLAGTLPALLGMRFVSLEPDCVVAELEIRDALRTIGGRCMAAR